MRLRIKDSMGKFTKHFCVILTLLLLHLGTHSALAQTSATDSSQNYFNHTIDSTMALSPRYMPVYKTKLPGTFFNPIIYHHIDTTIFHTAAYDPLCRVEHLYQSLGIYAQAHKNIVFDYKHDIGFSMINHPYPLYFKKQTDIDYYKVKNSFTHINYNYGITKENSVWITHAQKIKSFDYKFDIQGYRNAGHFFHQGTNLYAMDLVAHYETPKDHYGVLVSYILNHGKFSENGGLSNYRLFTDRENHSESITTDLSAYGVMLNNAASTINNHDLLVQQYVNIKDHKDRYYGTITHSFEFQSWENSFFDHTLNDDYYLGRYYLHTDTTQDTLHFFSLINTLQWSNYKPLQTQSEANYYFRVAGGIRHEYVHAAMPFYVGNNYTLFARTSIRLFSVWDLYGNIAYSFNNYNKNDAIANASALFAINRKQRHFIGFGADFYRVSPDMFFSYYTGNNNVWYLQWKKQNNLKLNAFWTIFNYKIDFNYFLMGRYLYLNNHFEPTLVEKPINITQLNFFAPVRIKHFSLDLNMSLQHSSNPAIAVPIFAGKLCAAYGFNVFRNRLHIQIGGDLMYNTLYFADGYNPIVHQFYRQNSQKVGNYLYFDMNITMQVERIAFFVRASNLLDGVFGYTYFTTPNYPMEGRRFQIGISWKFYD